MSESKFTTGEALLFGPLAITVTAAMVAAYIPLQLFGAWCDMHIWNWFAAPYLHLPLMPLWVSFGIGLWMRMNTSSTKVVKGEETLIWKGVGGAIFMHSTALLVGYLIHRFIMN